MAVVTDIWRTESGRSKRSAEPLAFRSGQAFGAFVSVEARQTNRPDGRCTPHAAAPSGPAEDLRDAELLEAIHDAVPGRADEQRSGAPRA